MAPEAILANRPAWGRVLAQICALAVVYVASAKIGLLAHFSYGEITAIWPPTGISLAALLLFGFRVWPGIALGAFASTVGDLPVIAGLGVAAGNTLEALLGAWLLLRVAGFRNAMDRLSDVVGLVLFAATVSTMVSASIGVASLFAAGRLSAAQLGASWATWWLSNVMSALIVAPVVLTWADNPRIRGTPALAAEALGAFGILCLIALGAFGWWPIPAEGRHASLFLCFPVLIWVVLRFGRRGATAANLMIAAVALWAIALGGRQAQSSNAIENLFYLDVILVALALTGLILAAVVAQRGKAEAALLTSQVHLEIAQTQARMGSWEIVGVEFRAVHWSKGMFRLFRRDPRLGAPTSSEFLDLIHPDDRDSVVQTYRAAVQSQDGFARFEFRSHPALGEVRYFTATARVMRGEDGRPERLIGTTLDVTDYKRLEAQLVNAQKMEAVGRLAGGIAHDFNNLLTVIFGYGDLLTSTLVKDERAHGLAVKVGETARRAAALTKQLLAFSRRQIMTLTVVDLNRVVTATEEMMRRLIGEDIAVRTTLDPGLACVRADIGQVEQVIMNLVVNARDAMPEGGEIVMETHDVEMAAPLVTDRSTIPAGRYARLVIADTGEGIDEENLPHIFDPFFTTKEVGKGTGLGLAMVYGIVRQMDGHVTVMSSPGQGTIFSIYLPVQKAEVEGDKAPSRDAESQVVPRGSETLLLVEDDDAVRTVLAESLKSLGYDVIAAPNAEEGLRLGKVNRVRFDLLVTDVVMPGMSGRDLAQRLTAVQPELKVIFISGYTDDAMLRRDILSEGFFFLQKPFTIETLARKISEVLTPRAPRASP